MFQTAANCQRLEQRGLIMIASVRIYDGAKINPENDLLRTVRFDNVVSVKLTGAKNDIYRITRDNGDTHEFATACANILIE